MNHDHTYQGNVFHVLVILIYDVPIKSLLVHPKYDNGNFILDEE